MVEKQDKQEFNQDLEILKVTIKADYALGIFLAKFTGMVAAIVALLVLWYQVRFPTPSNNALTYLDPWYYFGSLAIALIGTYITIRVSIRPYKKARENLEALIEGIRRKQPVGSLSVTTPRRRSFLRRFWK
jgi:hypothetical protein